MRDPNGPAGAAAPAKLTWSLRVLGTRPDGFHELEALATTVDQPHDAVRLESSDRGISLRVTGVDRDVPADDTNLAWRAAAAAGLDVAITLEKQIPAGGGLGGGSSDAAAVLRALVDHFGLDPRRAEAIAAELGSDVPMCLRGGTAWMRGRGERIESIGGIPPTTVVIATPPLHSSTPAVYRAWDELGGPRATRAIAAPSALAGCTTALVNDLEPAAEAVEPRLAEFRRAFQARGRPRTVPGRERLGLLRVARRSRTCARDSHAGGT